MQDERAKTMKSAAFSGIDFKFIWRVFVGFVIFFFVYFLSTIVYLPNKAPLSGKWQLTINGKTEMKTVPFSVSLESPATAVLTKKFPMVEGDTIVIPAIYSNGFEVYLNGTLLSRYGSISNGSDNMWNTMFTVPFDKKDLKEENIVEIKTYSLFAVGLSSVPYIGSAGSSGIKLDMYKFLDADLCLIAIGSSFTLGLILLLLGLSNLETRVSYSIVGISSILIGLYLFDYIYWTAGNAFDFLVISKMLIISAYAASFLFLAGIEKYLFGLWKMTKILFFPFVAVTVNFVIQPDVAVLWKNLVYGEVFVVLVLVVITAEVYLSKNHSLVIPITVMGAIAVQGVLADFFGSEPVFTFAYGVIFAISGFGIVLVENYKTIHEKMIRSHRNSMTDPLTGVFNRSVLSELELFPEDMLVMIDINSFKGINDTYGHEKGDRILKVFSDVASGSLRTEDLIIRMGGDEFLIILRDCDKWKAKITIKRIKHAFSELTEGIDVDFAYGIVKVGDDFSGSLRAADLEMYMMKTGREECISQMED